MNALAELEFLREQVRTLTAMVDRLTGAALPPSASPDAAPVEPFTVGVEAALLEVAEPGSAADRRNRAYAWRMKRQGAEDRELIAAILTGEEVEV